MELGLSWRGDYTLRAAVELARFHDDHQWHKASALAQATGIPPGYIRQILGDLVHHGVVEARSGNTGGYRLSRHPGQITVLELVEVGEGPLVSVRCVMRGTGCSSRRPCLLHNTVARAREALRHELESATLESVVPRDRARLTGRAANV